MAAQSEEFISKGLEYLPLPKSQFKSLLDYLSDLRSSKDHQDITINCRGRHFQAHKIILSGQSSTLRQKLATRSGPVLDLDVDPDLFELALDYMYKGTANVDARLASELGKLSYELGLEELMNRCYRYEICEKGLSIDNCIKAWETACCISDADLENKSLKIVLDNIKGLQSSPAFLKLSFENAKVILSHPDLAVTPDERLTAALDWVREEAAYRRSHLVAFLGFLPLEKMTPNVLQYAMRVDPMLKTHAEACKLINDAIDSPPQQYIVMTRVCKFADNEWKPASKDVYVTQISDPTNCKSVATLPATVLEESRIASCVQGDSLWVSGVGVRMDEVWVLDMKKGVWSEAAKLSEPRVRHCMISVTNRVYVLSGKPDVGSIKMHESVLVMDKGSVMWKKVGKLTGDMFGNVCCCRLRHGDILLYGVYDKEGNLTLQIYSTQSDSVTRTLSLPDRNCLVYGVLVVGDTVFMVSYNNTYTCPVASVYKEDPSTAKVRYTLKTPNVACAVGLGKDARHIILLGGDPRDKSRRHHAYRVSVSEVLNNKESGWEKMKEDWPLGRSAIAPGAVCSAPIQPKLLT